MRAIWILLALFILYLIMVLFIKLLPFAIVVYIILIIKNRFTKDKHNENSDVIDVEVNVRESKYEE